MRRAHFPTKPVAPTGRAVFRRKIACRLDADLADFPADPKGMARRVACSKLMNAIAPRLPALIGGSSGGVAGLASICRRPRGRARGGSLWRVRARKRHAAPTRLQRGQRLCARVGPAALIIERKSRPAGRRTRTADRAEGAQGHC